ncbi:hypothetical protein LIA77_05204 [Sarocladium implicatum]|nr:hypothetical protein LIA77_05204 [Sarocladium implicatum]
MSSAKSSSQQCTTSRRRNIVTTTATSRKQPSLINNTTSTDSPTSRPDDSTIRSHAANARRITYSGTIISARHKAPSALSEPQSRVPLQPKDRNHNARAVTPASCVLLAKSSAPSTRSIKMPPINGGSDRPRQPQLAAKPLRPPLTPKVASKGSYSQPVTPIGRRALNQTPTVASLATTKDEAASPLAPFLAHNITPRSGSRQSRVESTNTTPSGTPVPDRSSDGWTDSLKLAGLGVSVPASESGRSSVPGSAVGAESADSKFFYASDARSSQNSSQTQRPTVASSKSPPTFFYANGTSTNSSAQTQNLSNGSHAAQASTASESGAAKFLYANGTPDISTRGNLPQSGSGSVVSSTSRVPYSRPTTSTSAMPPTIPPINSRPASPIKAASTPSAHTVRTNPSASTPALVPSTLAPAPKHVGFRRDSIESSSQRSSRGHSRTGSIPTIESVTGARLTQSPTSPGATSPLPSPGIATSSLTMANIMQAVDAIGEEEEDTRISDTPSGLQSPTKSVHNDPMNELVVNARRERKVQDLEITNASLEAINRTLERQLRKQTAELRRYRRLSRSGRLSLASVASSRVTSGTSTVQGDLPDLSEEEYSDEDQDSSEQDDLSGSESISMDDPLSPEMRGLTRRKRDERRLEIDLSKHRELLVDSQKINQSLKRCLDWTEVLIKEGKKALDYHVRVSEVELGGRVLAPPDEDEDELSHLDETDTMSKPSRPQSPQPPSSGQFEAEAGELFDD